MSALCAATVAGAVLAPSAGAATFLRGFGEPAFEADSASERTFWYDKAVEANSNLARVNISWRGVVTGGKPVAPTNPADPGYSFARADRAINDAAARGLRILVTVFDAPEFAEAAGQPSNAPDGTWKPDPAALQEFAQAVATRYSGSFIPVGSLSPLPRVGYFEGWNEPNLTQYLTPQSTKGKLTAANHYRGLINGFYAGVKASSNSIGAGRRRLHGPLRRPHRGSADPTAALPPGGLLPERKAEGDGLQGRGAVRHPRPPPDHALRRPRSQRDPR